jgi:hypothetical protein
VLDAASVATARASARTAAHDAAAQAALEPSAPPVEAPHRGHYARQRLRRNRLKGEKECRRT